MLPCRWSEHNHKTSGSSFPISVSSWRRSARELPGYGRKGCPCMRYENSYCCSDAKLSVAEGRALGGLCGRLARDIWRLVACRFVGLRERYSSFGETLMLRLRVMLTRHRSQFSASSSGLWAYLSLSDSSPMVGSKSSMSHLPITSLTWVLAG